MFKRSAQDIHAVKSVYLEVEDGELLSILGHNGAGNLCVFLVNNSIKEKPLLLEY